MIFRIGKIKYQISKLGIFPIIDNYPNHKLNEQDKDFDGKVMVVIGGSSGIGLSIVEKFLSHGANVVATARSMGELRDVHSDKLEFREWDIANLDAIEINLDAIIANYGKIDCVVLNAGVNRLPFQVPPRNFLEQKKVELEYIHQINVIGICEICKVLKTYVFQKRLSALKVINIISAGALLEEAGAYFTSKRALYSFTKAFAEECKGHIHVYGIAPGEVRTRMIRNRNFSIVSHMAKDRRKAHPDEIAELASLMVAESGNALAGNIVVFDGGETVASKF